MKTRIYLSKSYNPHFNLALEEYLLNSAEEDELTFYLWQNAHTIVIGKHQNPWKEINVDKFEKDGGKLARRLTGGGAVYHDLGNVNFTFCGKSNMEDLQKQFSVIVGALNNLGIAAEFSGRNDILADSRKFSGNAFYRAARGFIHHGTIMLDVDLTKMADYLNVSEKKLKSKGVDSVKSRVINLITLREDLTPDLLNSAMISAFSDIYCKPEEIIYYSPENAPQNLLKMAEHYASWDWLYGKSPKFEYTISERFDWGEIDILLHLGAAVIEDCMIYSDAMDTLFIDKIQGIFSGTVFKKENLLSSLADFADKNPDYSKYIDDISSHISTLEL